MSTGKKCGDVQRLGINSRMAHILFNDKREGGR